MPFPNHPDKHTGEPLITPQRHTNYVQSVSEGELSKPPNTVILCYSRGLMDYFTSTYDGKMIDRYYGDLYVFKDTGHVVGVLGNFGIGAPTTAMQMEELIADGVETFLSIGFAGCLDDTIEMGDFIVCEKAIRDEGTSHHYAESKKYATPTESLVRTIEQDLREQSESFHTGPSWTTDAIYRETKDEVERYAAEGVFTVEMEAATVFTVGEHYDVHTGAIFVVSDYLGPADWEPKFHVAGEDLEQLGDTAKEMALQA